MKKVSIIKSAVVIMAIAWGCSCSMKNESSNSKAVLDNIMTRSSIRAFQNKPVEEEKVQILLRAAMAAPSAGNKQPWEFVLITDERIKNTIADSIRTAGPARTAPLCIAVCGDMTNTFPEDGRDYWVEDTSAASENILLAAHGIGLGGVWMGIYPMRKRIHFLKELLNLPDRITPLNVIAIGYPAQEADVKDKWDESRIHRNQW